MVTFDSMKLKAYRDMIGMSVKDAASANGVTPTCWRYWENGSKIPARENMVDLYEWSLGHVAPNDFYDLPVSEGEAGHSSFKAQGRGAFHGASAGGNGHAMPGRFEQFAEASS